MKQLLIRLNTETKTGDRKLTLTILRLNQRFKNNKADPPQRLASLQIINAFITLSQSVDPTWSVILNAKPSLISYFYQSPR